MTRRRKGVLPDRWLRAVLRSDLTSAEKVVATAVYLNMSDTGIVHVGRRQIADAVGLGNEQRASDRVGALKRAGFLSQVGGGHRGTVATYTAMISTADRRREAEGEARKGTPGRGSNPDRMLTGFGVPFSGYLSGELVPQDGVAQRARVTNRNPATGPLDGRADSAPGNGAGPAPSNPAAPPAATPSGPGSRPAEGTTARSATEQQPGDDNPGGTPLSPSVPVVQGHGPQPQPGNDTKNDFLERLDPCGSAAPAGDEHVPGWVGKATVTAASKWFDDGTPVPDEPPDDAARDGAYDNDLEGSMT